MARMIVTVPGVSAVVVVSMGACMMMCGHTARA